MITFDRTLKRLMINFMAVHLACSTAKPTFKPTDFDELTAGNSCEDASLYLSQHAQQQPLKSKVKSAFGLPLSYAAMGLGYTTDVLLIFAGGVAVSALVCSPVIIMELATGSSGAVASSTAPSQCLVAAAELFEETGELPSIGDYLKRSTRSWQCADLTPLSEQLRAIAHCYANRSDSVSLRKSYEQMVMLKNQKDLLRCVSSREQEYVEQDFMVAKNRVESLEN